ncbi:MAG: AMP-binding enzyme, partial [Steroidobacteraceae bacterium]
MSLVKARRSPITGALVVADVVLAAQAETGTQRAGSAECAVPADSKIREEILADCRRSLATHKVPSAIRFVPTLPLTAAGKVARADA